MMITALAMMGGSINISKNVVDEEFKIWLKQEYSLIKNKKSKLSKSERDRVEYQYNKFIDTEPEET